MPWGRRTAGRQERSPLARAAPPSTQGQCATGLR
jgi:hypothetical protein